MSSLDALREECEQVSEVVLELPEGEFSKPTRCTAWNVKELLGHMYRDVDRLNTGLSEPPPSRADTDSVSYWHSYDPKKDSPATAERAKEVAAGFATGHDLAEAWDEMWRRAVRRTANEDPGRVIKTWGPALTLEEFLRTRVLEICVHRMDLEDALGRKCWGTDEGVSIVDDILVGLLGQEPSYELDWDVVQFIEVATGRRAVSGEEKEILGRLAGRFPLIG